MSGEGVIASEHPIWSVARERSDTLAYLRQRRANAQRIAKANPGEEDRARIIDRECEIVIEYIEAGLHEGACDAAAHLDAQR